MTYKALAVRIFSQFGIGRRIIINTLSDPKYERSGAQQK